MDKELSMLKENVAALKDQLQLLNKHLMRLEETASKSSSKSDPAVSKMETELEALRKIVGNFRPFPNAQLKTYQELLQENQNFEKENAKHVSVIKEKDLQLRRLKTMMDRMEGELLVLRSSNALQQNPAEILSGSPSTNQKPGKKEESKKPRHLFHKGKKRHTENLNSSDCIPSFSESPMTPSEEKRRLEFQSFLAANTVLSDEQIRFLVAACLEHILSAEDLFTLSDPRLSLHRMQSVYRLFMAKKGVAVPADAWPGEWQKDEQNGVPGASVMEKDSSSPAEDPAGKAAASSNAYAASNAAAIINPSTASDQKSSSTTDTIPVEIRQKQVSGNIQDRLSQIVQSYQNSSRR